MTSGLMARLSPLTRQCEADFSGRILRGFDGQYTLWMCCMFLKDSSLPANIRLSNVHIASSHFNAVREAVT